MEVVGALGLQVCGWLARVQDVSFFLSFARLVSGASGFIMWIVL